MSFDKFYYKSKDCFLLYQPQYYNNSIFGAEALLRSIDTVDRFPYQWYMSLTEKEKENLDLIIIRQVILDISKYQSIMPISVNVNTSFFNSKNLEYLTNLLCEYKINKDKFIIEIVEKNLINQTNLKAIQEFLDQGFIISIDDIPDNYSLMNLDLIKDLKKNRQIICKINTKSSEYNTDLIYDLIDKGYPIVLEQVDPSVLKLDLLKKVVLQTFSLSEAIPLAKFNNLI